jgi:hypothetical protein
MKYIHQANEFKVYRINKHITLIGKKNGRITDSQKRNIALQFKNSKYHAYPVAVSKAKLFFCTSEMEKALEGLKNGQVIPFKTREESRYSNGNYTTIHPHRMTTELEEFLTKRYGHNSLGVFGYLAQERELAEDIYEYFVQKNKSN